jgi:hypothetical protein
MQTNQFFVFWNDYKVQNLFFIDFFILLCMLIEDLQIHPCSLKEHLKSFLTYTNMHQLILIINLKKKYFLFWMHIFIMLIKANIKLKKLSQMVLLYHTFLEHNLFVDVSYAISIEFVLIFFELIIICIFNYK